MVDDGPLAWLRGSTMSVLLGAHRPPREQLPTAELRAAVRYDSVSGFLYRWVDPLGQHYPGTTLAALRELSLRDIGHLIYWRGQAIAAQNERRRGDDDDASDDMFGEVR